MRSGFFGRNTPPSLAQLLAKAERVDAKVLVRAILDEAVEYYDTTLHQMKYVGGAGGAGAVSRSARKVAAAIHANAIKTVAEARGKFSKHFDNDLLQRYRTGTAKQRDTIEHFYYHSLRWMRDRDPDAAARCPDTEARAAAYHDAFAKLVSKMRSPTFTFSKGASILFRTIFYGKCHDEGAHYRSDKESRRRQHPSLEQLPRGGQRLLSNQPRGEATLDLAIVAKAFPDCVALLSEKYYGYKYRELTSTFDGTEDQLRRRAYDCIRKINKYLNPPPQ